MKIADIMTPCPYRIGASTSLDEALEKMSLRNIRHLPVIEGSRLVGVLSERDARLSKLVCEVTGNCPTAGAVCSTDPHIFQAEDDVSIVAKEMAERKIDCALVADEAGNFVGIFTTTDACRLIHLILEEISSGDDE